MRPFDRLAVACDFESCDAFVSFNKGSALSAWCCQVHGIYSALALQENIAVDFVDEDGMAEAATLAEFTTLFLTQPNIPAGTVAPLVAWVKAGGTLVTTSNAAHWDE